MAYTNPVVQDFKNRFVRDFPYNTDSTLGVTDTDIGQAFVDTNSSLDPELFGTQADYTNGYLLLAAHNLVSNIRMSTGGLSGGGFKWLQQSTSVGSVAQGFGIPQKILDNPVFAAFCTTQYGGKYLATYVLPDSVGNFMTVAGTTQP